MKYRKITIDLNLGDRFKHLEIDNEIELKEYYELKNRIEKAKEYIMTELITEWNIKNGGCVSGSDLPVDAITPILNILNGGYENE